jgi:hypothetical protein
MLNKVEAERPGGVRDARGRMREESGVVKGIDDEQRNGQDNAKME